MSIYFTHSFDIHLDLLGICSAQGIIPGTGGEMNGKCHALISSRREPELTHKLLLPQAAHLILWKEGVEPLRISVSHEIVILDIYWAVKESWSQIFQFQLEIYISFIHQVFRKYLQYAWECVWYRNWNRLQ